MVPDVWSLLSVTITVVVVLPFVRYGTLFSIKLLLFYQKSCPNIKQLLDEVLIIPGIISLTGPWLFRT